MLPATNYAQKYASVIGKGLDWGHTLSVGVVYDHNQAVVVVTESLCHNACMLCM